MPKAHHIKPLTYPHMNVVGILTKFDTIFTPEVDSYAATAHAVMPNWNSRHWSNINIYTSNILMLKTLLAVLGKE